MDITKTYIKMSDHPLIQGQWESKKGDFYFSRDGLFRPTRVVDVYNAKGYAILPRDANYGWLPTQNQIQKMMLVDYNFPYELLMDFYKWVMWVPSGLKPNSVMETANALYKTFEQLWLAFYMDKKHGHTSLWDNAGWGEWIKGE